MSIRVRLNETVKSIKKDVQAAVVRFTNQHDQGLNPSQAIYSLSPEIQSINTTQEASKRKAIMTAMHTIGSLAAISATSLAMAVSEDNYQYQPNTLTTQLTDLNQTESPSIFQLFEDELNYFFEKQRASCGELKIPSKGVYTNDDLDIEIDDADYFAFTPINPNDWYSTVPTYNLNAMHVTAAYRDVIIKDEGQVRNKANDHLAYNDGSGIMTIGYGHAREIDGVPIKRGDTITESQAQALLDADIKIAEDAVKDNVDEGIILTQGQFNALIGFVFNKGSEALANSTLLKEINKNNITGAASQFERWVYTNQTDEYGQIVYNENGRAKKVKSEGLMARATRDSAMYLSSFPQGFLGLNKTFKTLENQFDKKQARLQKELNRVVINDKHSPEKITDLLEKIELLGQERIHQITEYRKAMGGNLEFLAHIKNDANSQGQHLDAHLSTSHVVSLMNSAALTDMADQHIEIAQNRLAPLALEVENIKNQLAQVSTLRENVTIASQDALDGLDRHQLASLSESLNALSVDFQYANENQTAFNLVSAKNSQALGSFLNEVTDHVQDKIAHSQTERLTTPQG